MTSFKVSKNRFCFGWRTPTMDWTPGCPWWQGGQGRVIPSDRELIKTPTYVATWVRWRKDEGTIFWVVVSNIFYCHPYLGKIPILTNIFQRDWNHKLVLMRHPNDIPKLSVTPSLFGDVFFGGVWHDFLSHWFVIYLVYPDVDGCKKRF